MRAAVLNSGEIVVRDDVEEPVPVLGQALVQVRACGICGSDLHFAKHGASMLALGKEMTGGLGGGGEAGARPELGYDPMEFAGSLRSIAEGEIDVAPMVTAEVPLEETAWAFEALGNPEEHCKIVVKP